MRGVAYGELGQHQRAIEDYDKAIQLDPNEASLYNNRGIVYRNLGQGKKSDADKAKACSLDSKYCSNTPTPTLTPTPTPTPTPIFGREYIDGEIARIRDFTPNYIAQGDITQICADVNQSLSRVNVFGAALTLDVYVEQIASFYWNAEFRSYAVRIFQGLKSPEELSC